MTQIGQEKVVEAASLVVAGEIEPYEGAARIWRLISEANYDGFEDLRVWAGLASEWREHPDHRQKLDRDIREEAARLVKQAR
jgi:hypothetical protein